MSIAGYFQRKKRIWPALAGLFLLMAVCAAGTGRSASAAGASVSISTKNNRVVSGDTVYVVITVKSSEAISGFEGYFSYDNRVLQYETGGSVISGNDDEFSVSDVNRSTGVTSIKYSVKFRARKAGSTTIALKKPYSVYRAEDSAKMSVSYNSLNIVVTREPDASPAVKATPQPTAVPSSAAQQQPGTVLPPKQSPSVSGAPAPQKTPETTQGSAQLKMLQVGGVALTPEFRPDIYRYSGLASTYDTKLDITCTPVDSAAKVTVRGNKNLQMGKNVIRVKVRGTSGHVKNYRLTIKINEPEPSPSPSEDGVKAVVSGGNVTLYGTSSVQVEEVGKEEDIPEGFGKTELEIDGQVVTAYALESETEHNYVLIYGRSGEEKEFYLYDRKQNTLMPYEKVKAWYRSGAGGVVVESESKAELTALRLKYIVGILLVFCALMILAVISVYMRLKGMDQDDLTEEPSESWEKDNRKE